MPKKKKMKFEKTEEQGSPERCGCQYLAFDSEGNCLGERECQRAPITFVDDWRFGNVSQGEPAFVEIKLYTCADCLYRIQESRAEAEAEARIS